MNAGKFLASLETKDHSYRSRHMVEVGQSASEGNPEHLQLLNELEHGRFYERSLCLQSCYGSRDGERVLRLTRDASSLLRTMALRLVAIVCDDAQAMAAMTAMPFDRALRLLRWLLKAKRQQLVDAYLTHLLATSPEQAAALLPFGSPVFVQEHRVLISARLGAGGWKRMARLHSELTAEMLIEQAKASDRFDPRLLWQANLALPKLAETLPDRALEAVAALQPLCGLSRLNVQPLALRRPDPFAALMIETGDRTNVNFERRVERIEPRRLHSLLERFPETLGNTALWLERLAPHQRQELFEAYGVGWRDSQGAVPPEIVALLPRDLRETEARRNSGLPSLAANPLRRLQSVGFLPWEEARAAVAAFLQNPDADLRSAAHRALAVCVRYHRDRLPELLGSIHARRNEQDPVRLAMMTGIAELPPGMFREEHLEALGEIVFDALAAADLSYPTGAALQDRLATLLPFHPGWAAGKIAFVMQKFGHSALGNLETRLSDDDVRRIAPELLPVLEDWKKREREYDVLSFAQSLGRRLKVFPDLAQMLERMLRSTRNHYVSSSALALLAQHRRDRMNELIPELLQSDGSWATQAVVHLWLHRKRQDLLTPYLGRKAYSGRFSTGKTRFLLPLAEGFHRWTRTQQETFALTLTEVMQDSRRDNYGIFGAIHQFAALPDVSPAPLADLAVEDSKNPPLRDTALRAIGRLDAGQGVPLLLEALNDDRARIAIYALRPALLEMPSERALELLSDAPTGKVTVAKEVIRLLGDLRTEGAYQRLLSLEAQDLHRDSRIALLRALWEHLERKESWTIFEQAARSPDEVLALSVCRIPADQLSTEGRGKLVAVLATLLEHSNSTVRLSTLLRCDQLPVADHDRILLPRLLAELNSSVKDLIRAGAEAVFATYFGSDAPVIGEALQRLLPNRQALSIAVETLILEFRANARLMEPTARAALNALSGDPLTINLQTRIATLALPWRELALWLKIAAEAQVLHADALQAARQTLQSIAFRSDFHEVDELESALAKSSDPILRRLALETLVQSGANSGWTEARRNRLSAYQRDASPLVAEAALFTFPPEMTDS